MLSKLPKAPAIKFQKKFRLKKNENFYEKKKSEVGF